MSWSIRRFERDYLKKPGQHLLEIGQTGRGKTQGLYYILDGIIAKNPNEKIVWVDTGKTSELLTLARFKPLHLLIPEGCDIEINPRGELPNGITRTYITSHSDAWDNLDSDAINVISVSRFIRRHAPYARVISKLFQALIDYAYDYHLPVPLAVFIDEAQFVMPSKAVAYNTQHLRAGLDVAAALFTLRSLQVRFVAATQGWNLINPPGRMSFPWFFIRGGTYFTGDQPRLSKFNELWAPIPQTDGYIAAPDRSFSDKLTGLPFYGDGISLGSVNYYGRLDKPKNDENSGP